MDEPNPTHGESSGQGKVDSDFLNLARRFGANIVPPRMPHEMNECLGSTLVYSPWAKFVETEASSWAKSVKFRLGLQV